MSMHFMIGNKSIFQTSNSVFEILTNFFEEYAAKNNLMSDREIYNLITEMQLISSTMFPYFDIAKYLKTAQLSSVFIDILEHAIVSFKNKGYISATASLCDLHKELTKYNNSLTAL